MKRLNAWLKKACRTNRVLRTFIQGISSYLIVQLPVFWNGQGDLSVALEALLVGAFAAGISAVWKTAEADLSASLEKEAP